MVGWAQELDIPYLPGVMTPTEVQAGLATGLTYMKVFPASVVGPHWVTTLAGPFPAARFVATGGVDAHNAAAFLHAGAYAVGVGSALEDSDQLPLLAALTPRTPRST
jgi:2-keto-3-deoxy-6-phosphogluconate aldolase